MQLFSRIVFWVSVALAGSLGSSMAAAVELTHDDLTFSYQGNVEPWDHYACKHEKAAVGAYGWNVYCKVGTRVHRYGIHLALSYYPRTIHGGSAYELLYWVTDWTTPQPLSTSTTLWFHQREPDSKAVVIEAAQGVENDLSSLRLTIKIADR